MDQHCQAILDEYNYKRDSFLRIQDIVINILEDTLTKEGIQYADIKSRIKTRESLAGKLERKGYKYKSLDDITDIFGARVSTLYNDEVDLVAAIVERIFDIDWENSIDKRKLLESDRFGYLSIHYICRIPESLYKDDAHPEINDYRFEIQIRTVLQNIWATINHDIGYKSIVEIPVEYKRTISRLAGLLEIADEEFKRFRRDIDEYRRSVTDLVTSGKFDEVEFNMDSFNNYLAMDPFARLNESIASALKAEITPGNLQPYYKIFRGFQFKTLCDLENLRREYSDDAKRLALHRMAGLELDIMSSTVGIFNLCVVYILKNGYGKQGLIMLHDVLAGKKADNARRAERIIRQAIATNIIEEKDIEK